MYSNDVILAEILEHNSASRELTSALLLLLKSKINFNYHFLWHNRVSYVHGSKFLRVRKNEKYVVAK